jgi:hypothetical protein
MSILKFVNLSLALVSMGLALVLKVQYYCDHLAHVHALSLWSCLVVKAITK